MKSSQNITHLVFDMGGVLIRLHWHENVSKMLGRDIDSSEIHQLWENSPAASGFDKGLLDFDTFYYQFQIEFGTSLNKQRFKQLFAAMIQPDYPESLTTLDVLSKKYSLTLLSNTNPFHWEMIQRRNTFLPYFDYLFTSMVLGLMKPDPEIYRSVESALEVAPGAILFFDDSSRNVEAARAQGWNAEVVTGMTHIDHHLRKYGALL